MNSVDWTAKAHLQQRDDSGSDMFYEFKTIGEGPLAQLVAQAMAMSSHDRARLVLDVEGRGMLDVGQIVALGERPDFPKA